MNNNAKLAVSAVIIKGGEVLLVKRGKPPMAGSWNLPGGKVKHGEDLTEAIKREVFEETSLMVSRSQLLGKLEIKHADSALANFHYDLNVFQATIKKGVPKAGSDVTHATFVPFNKLKNYDLPKQTIEYIKLAKQKPLKHSFKGHVRTALIAIAFGFGAYAFLYGLMYLLKATGFQSF